MGQDARPLVVVTNREPYEDVASKTGWAPIQRAGGVTAALEPVLQALGGDWIAWGSGAADALAAPTGIRMVPPADPRYRLHRIFLSAEEVVGYYAGYANQGLWPLSHLLVERAHFRRDDWVHYRTVNQRFADTVAARAPLAARVFSHDYQLALVPAFVRQRRPDLSLVHFWHIPWAPWRIFHLCPQADELVRGLLGADVIGFQTQADQTAFLEAASHIKGAAVTRDGSIRWAGRTIRADVFPATVDAAAIAALVTQARTDARIQRLRRHLARADQQLVLSVDRADYTKGILPRLAAVDRFLTTHAHRRGRVIFVQVVVPTRHSVPDYRDVFERVLAESARINTRFGQEDWRPIVTVGRLLDRDRLLSLMAAADIGFVTSLYDGMNLVAKEFVAGRVAEDGVLLLSQSAGSADEMTEACLVNPMDPDGMADALEQALSMPVAERQRRMHRLRANLLTYGPQEWLGAISRTADRGGRGLRRGEVDEAREALGPRNDGVPTSSPQAVHS